MVTKISKFESITVQNDIFNDSMFHDTEPLNLVSGEREKLTLARLSRPLDEVPLSNSWKGLVNVTNIPTYKTFKPSKV